MGQTAADRLREVADRLDAKGDDLKEGARNALDKVAAQLEAIADKIEAGEDVEDSPPEATQLPAGDQPRVDNTLPGQ